MFKKCDSDGDAKSKDGRIQLHLPGGWSETELPGSIGKIQAKSTRDKDVFCSHLDEARGDFQSICESFKELPAGAK